MFVWFRVVLFCLCYDACVCVLVWLCLMSVIYLFRCVCCPLLLLIAGVSVTYVISLVLHVSPVLFHHLTDVCYIRISDVCFLCIISYVPYYPAHCCMRVIMSLRYEVL